MQSQLSDEKHQKTHVPTPKAQTYNNWVLFIFSHDLLLAPEDYCPRHALLDFDYEEEIEVVRNARGG